MSLFDGYLMVDWSSAAVPKTGADSIWLAYQSDGELSLDNPATRGEAMQLVEEILSEASRNSQRILAGFDFAFGYPAGAAAALTNGGDWRDLWRLLKAEIGEGTDNSNTRFADAARLNAKFPGDGPFWGNGLKANIDGLPRKRPTGYGAHLPPLNRYAEEMATSAQEVWKLSGAGSVGGQALTGIAALEGLREKVPFRVWPLETLGDEAGHVVCEIYPSMVPHHCDEVIKDAGQVRSIAEVFSWIDGQGRLDELLKAPLKMPKHVRREEACMLGLTCEPLLSEAVHAGSYIRNPKEIYRRSFATVRAEADFSNLPDDLHPVATRLIHSCGMVDLPKDLSFSRGVYRAAHSAIQSGAPILCDCEMVGAGIIRRYLSENEVIVTLNNDQTPALAADLQTTRSAAAVELWREHIDGAVVVIGNAPTALFHLLGKLDQGWPKPAAILGFPVGFVGAAESKAALATNARGAEYISLQGRRGGSAMASAALNAFAAGLPEIET